MDRVDILLWMSRGGFVKIWHFGPLEVLWASASSTRTTPTTPSVCECGTWGCESRNFRNISGNLFLFFRNLLKKISGTIVQEISYHYKPSNNCII